ncbi:MAG: hypothetical protein UW18_C0017G0006 [Microgenomates group bacterium GW2011_GWF1_44_10]|nr:MAG: hypothetical protein UW18_C0017G0006 [Microgenomates group bacterium GW2011_GWF1_44_10]
MTTNSKEKKYIDYGDCPKCGYFLIKVHPTARCAKGICGFEMSWEKYKALFIKKELDIKY